MANLFIIPQRVHRVATDPRNPTITPVVSKLNRKRQVIKKYTTTGCFLGLSLFGKCKDVCFRILGRLSMDSTPGNPVSPESPKTP
eukprot:3098593-Amphidinium_carterae.1